MDAIGLVWDWLATHRDIIIIQTVNGIVTGMILALIASGLTLIFGIMDVVNFAHGELFMLGAYVGVVVLAFSGSFWLALVLSTLVVALIGAALQITTLRPLIGRDPLNTILATFGISLVLQNYALWQFGPVPRKLDEPITGQFVLFYLAYPWYRLLIALLSGRSSVAFTYSSSTEPTASGSGRPRRTGSWPRRWASRCRGCIPACSPSAPAWRPPAGCCSGR